MKMAKLMLEVNDDKVITNWTGGDVAYEGPLPGDFLPGVQKGKYGLSRGKIVDLTSNPSPDKSAKKTASKPKTSPKKSAPKRKP